MVTAPTQAQPHWYLARDDSGVIAFDEHGRLARARIREDGPQVCVEFEVTAVPVPARLGTELARTVFQDAALGPDRPFLAALPQGATEVLEEVRRHAPDARSRVAGATCLVQGRVR